LGLIPINDRLFQNDRILSEKAIAVIDNEVIIFHKFALPFLTYNPEKQRSHYARIPEIKISNL
jgi:hypothetical protein